MIFVLQLQIFGMSIFVYANSKVIKMLHAYWWIILSIFFFCTEPFLKKKKYRRPRFFPFFGFCSIAAAPLSANTARKATSLFSLFGRWKFAYCYLLIIRKVGMEQALMAAKYRRRSILCNRSSWPGLRDTVFLFWIEEFNKISFL